jgi:hypothetical protein
MYTSPNNVRKWGFICLTNCAAQDVGPKGLRIDAVAMYVPAAKNCFARPKTDFAGCYPDLRGIIYTPFTQVLGSKEELKQHLESHIALGQLAQPEKVTRC